MTLFISCEDHRNEQHLWTSSTPYEQNMDPQTLDSAFIVAENTGFIDGLVVIRNGFLIAEDYYNGYRRTKPHIIASVSKSVLSAIAGIALYRGDIDSLEKKYWTIFLSISIPELTQGNIKLLSGTC